MDENGQLSKEEAIVLADNKFWVALTDKERAEFQWFQRRLCMPFSVFHEAIEKTLGRPVWTHEFGLNREGIGKELRGEGPAPTMEDIINMIPKNKRITLVVDKGDD